MVHASESKIKMIKAITLDLEGTLISSAVSQFPRNGVRQFLDFCLSTKKELMWFTAVKTEKVHDIVNLFVEEGYFPEECLKIQCVEWINLPNYNVHFKDLELTNYKSNEVLAVDDWPGVYLPDQLSQLITVKEFEYPYSSIDDELQRVQLEISKRIS